MRSSKVGWFRFQVLSTAVAALSGRSTGCSNLLVGRSASGTGSPQIAYTSDAGFQYGAMGHYPGGEHPVGSMRTIYNEDSGAYAGEIAEANYTYNAVAYHGGMNEHQLAISETTFGGLVGHFSFLTS